VDSARTDISGYWYDWADKTAGREYS